LILGKHRVAIALLFVFDFAGAKVAPAQSARSDSVWMFDARVVQVVSGGTWTDGARTGHYRVVVRSDGTDVVHYSTVVQWMERQGTKQDLELVKTVELSSIAKRWFSMLDPDLRLSRGRWILAIDASDGPLRPAKHRPQFILGPPGSVTIR
jgi:hypothetical protein